MRCLLAVTVSCFEKVNPSEEESFIEFLLGAYMQNPSSFDWVVARLGSCFPQKIISRLVSDQRFFLLNTFLFFSRNFKQFQFILLSELIFFSEIKFYFHSFTEFLTVD